MRSMAVGATIGDWLKERLVHKKSGKMDCWQCYIAGLWPNASQLSAIHPCGSELARESGVSGDIYAGCAAVFAGKPAPTGSAP
jgi:hypothetical protein